MKKVVFLIMLFGGCVMTSCAESHVDSKIIFWKYDKNISFEKLCSLNLDDAYAILDPGLEIPLNDFDVCFWDEQIFVMNNSVYTEKSYKDKFRQIEKESDRGSIFFSVIVGDELIFNGLNRVMLLTASMKPYDDSKYPRMSLWATNSECVFFRFSYWPTLSRVSIWDAPEILGDVKSLFFDDIFDYFDAAGKIQHGRFDFRKFCEENQLTVLPF
jgi:hypothetical protein